MKLLFTHWYVFNQGEICSKMDVIGGAHVIVSKQDTGMQISHFSYT